LGIVVAVLFRGWLPFLSLTNSVKELKDDTVPEWGQHASTVGQKHRDSCVNKILQYQNLKKKLSKYASRV